MANIGKVRRQFSTDRVQKEFQDSTGTIVEQIGSVEFMNGALLEDVELVSGDNDINHKLGRALRGWWVVRQNKAADLFDKQVDNDLDHLTLTLNSSVGSAADPLIVSLWVF